MLIFHIINLLKNESKYFTVKYFTFSRKGGKMPKIVNFERVKKINEFRLKVQEVGFPTLKSFSEYLGVSYHHLTEVISGRRKSKSLMEKVEKIIKDGRKITRTHN